MVGAFLIYLVKVQRAMELLSTVNGKGERSTFFQLNFWSNVFAQFVWIHHKNKDRYFFLLTSQKRHTQRNGKANNSHLPPTNKIIKLLEIITFLRLFGAKNFSRASWSIEFGTKWDEYCWGAAERVFVFPLPQITCSNKWKIYFSVRSPEVKLQSAPVFRRSVLEYSDSSVLSHRASLFNKHTTLLLFEQRLALSDLTTICQAVIYKNPSLRKSFWSRFTQRQAQFWSTATTLCPINHARAGHG